MRITFVQYGDFRDAALRFASGGDETYASQRYSVDSVLQLTERAEEVCVISVTDTPYDEWLDGGVHVIGRQLYEKTTENELVELVAAQRPTHVVARSPIVPLLRWSLKNGLKTLPIFATSFPKEGLRSVWRYRRTAQVLNHRDVRWVGNHNRNSARALVRIGVDAAKVIPWDWPPQVTPEAFPAKRRDDPNAPFSLFYAGRVQETKGVGDAIRAVASLRKSGLDVRFSIAGSGETELYQKLAAELGVTEHVNFLGLIPHKDVVGAMHRHDVVVVPSQHAYPEGLPLTIYDAYCSRSPLVASDHPMFREQVVHGQAALVFRAGEPPALEQRIGELVRDPALYARLSAESGAAWERLQIPVKWRDLLERWLSDTEDDRRWLSERTIGSGRYD